MSYHNQTMEDASFEKQKEIMALLRQDQLTIVDVGGHIGQSIERYRSLFPDCRIYSFEPHPETFRTLEQNYGGRRSICCERLALGATTGTVDFYATRCTAASSLLPPEEFIIQLSAKRNYDFNKIEVPLDTLDRVAARLSLGHIDILKIDVQGTEMDVLRGAASLLTAGRIALIYTEAQFAETYTGQSDLNDIWNFLKNCGYVLWDLFPFVHTGQGRLWTANAIFISPEAARQITPGVGWGFPEVTPEPERPSCSPFAS